MKINMLLILATTVGALGVAGLAVAKQTILSFTFHQFNHFPSIVRTDQGLTKSV